MWSWKHLAALLLATIVTAGNAEILSGKCTKSGACFALALPDNTTSEAVFFQILAPTSFQWVALGQGHGMAASNMFVVYSSADGKSVTLSTRLGTGNSEPFHEGSIAQATLLEGSGIINNTMVANIRCDNCNSWQGGRMDFASASGEWIYAGKQGSALDTNDINASIQMHDIQGRFSWNFTEARGDFAQDPFTSERIVTTLLPSGGGGHHATLILVHGVLAGLAFVIIMPTGGIVLRLVPSRHIVMVHAGLQLLGYALYVVAFGIGLWLAQQAAQYGSWTAPHIVIGIIVFALMLLQPLFGHLHHRGFVKYARRTVASYVHLTIGRVIVVVGIVNGGLGLQLVGQADAGDYAAYGVVSGVFGLAYLATAVFGEFKRRQVSLQPSLRNNLEPEPKGALATIRSSGSSTPSTEG